jgi:hypothetical protein
LRSELASAFEDESMSLVPSVDLACEIARCPHCRPRAIGSSTTSREGLCEIHRARWNLEACTRVDTDREVMTGVYLESLMRRALESEDGGTQFLAAFERQARALEAVWEAHSRGAVALPAGVAEKVERARTTAPPFLRGSTTRTVTPATR